MILRLKQALSSRLDPSLYHLKPCAIPMYIKTEAKQLLDNLVAHGIICRLEPNETSEVCAQAGFVPKKSKKLRFVIDFTLLNKYIERPVHSFPSTDQIQQAIRHDTCFMACIDFPSGYFQLRLDKESQPLTVFNTEFGRYLFLRAPKDSQVQVMPLTQILIGFTVDWAPTSSSRLMTCISRLLQ